MTDNKYAVDISNLSFMYPAGTNTLKNDASQISREIIRVSRELIRGNLQKPNFPGGNQLSGKWIFRDLNVQIRRGEILGVIGRNGCGKTTLLKILTRVLYPTEGRIEIRGRVASLLAVGTGFQPEFTGKENVYMNGAILGLSRREIDYKYDSIVDFADIGDYLDEPVKHYSSGMRARLAFSVAAQLDSDVLILDEVLSVGDAGFRERSLEMIRRMRAENRTVILVSHNMGSIEAYCDRALMIKDGRMESIGDPHNVVRDYFDSFAVHKKSGVSLAEREDREGTGRLRITDCRFESKTGIEIPHPQSGDNLYISLTYESKNQKVLKNVDFGLGVFSEDGYKLSRFSTEILDGTFSELPPNGCVRLIIPRFPFVRGKYLLGFRVVVDGEVADYIPNAVELNAEEGDFFGTGRADDHSPVYVPHEWEVKPAGN